MIATPYQIAPLVQIKDEQFDINQTTDYDLLVELSPERLRVVVCQYPHGSIYWLEDYQMGGFFDDKKAIEWLNVLCQQHTFLGNNQWRKVIVSFNTPHFTLIPDEFFRKEYTHNYLELLREKIAENEQVLHYGIGKIQARNVFAVNTPMMEWVLNTYTPQAPVFLHQTHGIIENLMQQHIDFSKNGVLMHLYFEEGFLTISLAKDNKLLYCNKIAYKSAHDMGYFVMFVLDSLQLLPKEIRCELYGEITPYSEDYQLLQRFLPQLYFGKNPDKIKLGEAFEDLPEHRYCCLYAHFSIG
ncbi:MAG: DUF3822 family protein [Runella sp.]